MDVTLRLGPIQRHSRGIVGAIAAALLMTSCITVSVESEFDEDGSARHVYTATVERDVLAEFGETGINPEEDFAEAEEEAQAAGYEVERIDTDEELGLRISKTVEDNADLGQVINDFFSAGDTEGGQPVTAFIGSFIQDGDTHTLELTVDGDSLFGDELGTGDEEIPASMLSSLIEMTYSVRMPGEINTEETNGRILPDGRVQWDLPLSGTETFRAVSETEGDAFPLAMVLGGSALLLLIVGGAVFVLLRGRQTPAVAPVAPAPYADPEAPTTQLPRTPADD